MGLIYVAVIGLNAAGCCRIEYYTKLEEKKDGLSVYKLSNEDGLKRDFEGIRGFVCPLCNNHFVDNRKEINEQYEECTKKGFPRLSKCYSDYDYNVERQDCADVFELLENLYNEIQDIKANYDENCYFKYTCPIKNTEIYIIFKIHPKEKINSLHFKFKDERYQYERWKNDDNLKKSLLEERKKITEAYEKRQKQEKINLELSTRRIVLKKQWNEMNFKKEYQNYLKCIDNFKSHFDPTKLRLLNIDPRDLSTPVGNSLSYEFEMCNYGFKFDGGQYKLADYILQYSKDSKERFFEESSLYNLIRMTSEEQRMLNQYLDSNLEEYKRELEMKL